MYYLVDALKKNVGNAMGTNCAPLSVDCLNYSYNADFMHVLLMKNEEKLYYIDDGLPQKDCRFGDCVYLFIGLIFK